eukprot:SM000095S25007  [mRNA]  locus=s95:491904:498702:+ [translate_table: standard]
MPGEERFLALIVRDLSRGDSFRAACSPSPDLGEGFLDVPMARLESRPALPPDRDVQSSAVEEQAATVERYLRQFGWHGLDASKAILEVLLKVASAVDLKNEWRYWSTYDEPDFGPGPPRQYMLFMTDAAETFTLEDPTQDWKWISPQQALDALLHKDVAMTVGPLTMHVFSPHYFSGQVWKAMCAFQAQVYPPGYFILPMQTLTLKPFTKTNLVVFDGMYNNCELEQLCLGECLLVDPGACPGSSQKQCTSLPVVHIAEQLESIVSALPHKLLVFLSHHHRDHVQGLDVVAKSNPKAILIAHEATLLRLGENGIHLQKWAVKGGEEILVGNDRMLVIEAPGHTEGHLALFNPSTRTLIAGDHCVGQGSAVLDSSSGGDMQDYFDTTQRLIALKPTFLIPMHGCPVYQPEEMLQSYLRDRVQREEKILRAIEEGASTAYQVVSAAYSDTPPDLWPYALSNVMLHVRRLSEAQSLPQDFSLKTFGRSCGVAFYICCLPATARAYVSLAAAKSTRLLLSRPWATVTAAAGLAIGADWTIAPFLRDSFAMARSFPASVTSKQEVADSAVSDKFLCRCAFVPYQLDLSRSPEGFFNGLLCCLRAIKQVGTALGGTISGFYAFNNVMYPLAKRLPGRLGMQYLIGIPPIALASVTCAGITAGALPALAQLAVSSYHVSLASTNATISKLTSRVEGQQACTFHHGVVREFTVGNFMGWCACCRGTEVEHSLPQCSTRRIPSRGETPEPRAAILLGTDGSAVGCLG